MPATHPPIGMASPDMAEPETNDTLSSEYTGIPVQVEPAYSAKSTVPARELDPPVIVAVSTAVWEEGREIEVGADDVLRVGVATPVDS